MSVAGATTLRFWEVERAAGLLLLPFLAYSVFGTLLLNLSLDSNSVEVGHAFMLFTSRQLLLCIGAAQCVQERI